VPGVLQVGSLQSRWGASGATTSAP
jgi:hypothetical protein